MKQECLNPVGVATSEAAERHIEELFVSNFGMSSEQFRHELEAELEQASPEEQAEFEALVDEVNAIAPELNERLDRVSDKLSGMSATMSEMRQSVLSLSERVGWIEEGLRGENKQ